jgi:hypothetical protein
MAKPSWSTVNPSSGSGNDTVSVGASVHTGRSQRSGSLTFKATGVTDIPVSVTQTAKPEFVTVENVSAAKGGGNVTISGVSNSSKLTFALGGGDITISLPGTYSAGGANTSNGAAIAGDPGATEQFNFALTVSVPANTTIAVKTRIITVAANGGQSASATITQAAGDPTLSVNPTTLTIDANGTQVSVSVTSNTNWSVE